VFFTSRLSGFDEENYPLSVLLFASLPGFYVFFIGFSNKLRSFLSKYSNGIASLLGLILLILTLSGVINALITDEVKSLHTTMLVVFGFYLLIIVITWLFWLLNGDINLEKNIKDGKYK
jgi:hypothetical protein